MDERRRNAPRRRKQFCLSGCLPHAKLSSIVASADSLPDPTRRSASAASKSADPSALDLGKCVDLVCRIGGCCARHHHHLRRCNFQAAACHKRHSTDAFHYDASSYALNFDERDLLDEYPLRTFISRLPASPPRASPENCSF